MATINVQRNLYRPVISPTEYDVVILETQQLGVEIERVTATDLDSRVSIILFQDFKLLESSESFAFSFSCGHVTESVGEMIYVEPEICLECVIELAKCFTLALLVGVSASSE